MQVNQTLLSISEVGAKINLVKKEAIKEWLNNNNIKPLSGFGRRLVYSEFQIDMQIQYQIAVGFQKQFPDDWEKMFENASTDLHVTTAVLCAIKYESKKLDPLGSAKKQNQSNLEYYNREALLNFRKKSQ